MLVPSLSNVFIYLNFKIHQKEIAKNLCIQREMKNNHCNGHCFLSKQLKKTAEKEKKETESLKEKQELVYINSKIQNSLHYNFLIEKVTILISHVCEKPISITLRIFRPPLV